jgi:nitrogen fixation NifU-like protein
MPILNNPQVMRQIIMDHYEHPRHRFVLSGDDVISVRMNTSGCIDDITVYLKIKDQVIVESSFDGVACTISTASTSIMTELLVGLSLKQAEHVIQQYLAMIYEQPYDASALGEAVVFMYTYKQASRIKCATIGWTGADDLIRQYKEEKKHG